MNKENTSKLFKDFPKLYSGRKKPLTENLMGFGFECGDGWFDLIYELSKKITEIDPDCIATQVKEKYAGLRFYVHSASNETYRLIDLYENKSRKTCEYCGAKGKLHDRNGWYTTLCKKCWDDER